MLTAIKEQITNKILGELNNSPSATEMTLYLNTNNVDAENYRRALAEMFSGRSTSFTVTASKNEYDKSATVTLKNLQRSQFISDQEFNSKKQQQLQNLERIITLLIQNKPDPTSDRWSFYIDSSMDRAYLQEACSQFPRGTYEWVNNFNQHDGDCSSFWISKSNLPALQALEARGTSHRANQCMQMIESNIRNQVQHYPDPSSDRWNIYTRDGLDKTFALEAFKKFRSGTYGYQYNSNQQDGDCSYVWVLKSNYPELKRDESVSAVEKEQRRKQTEENAARGLARQLMERLFNQVAADVNNKQWSVDLPPNCDERVLNAAIVEMKTQMPGLDVSHQLTNGSFGYVSRYTCKENNRAATDAKLNEMKGIVVGRSNNTSNNNNSSSNNNTNHLYNMAQALAPALPKATPPVEKDLRKRLENLLDITFSDKAAANAEAKQICKDIDVKDDTMNTTLLDFDTLDTDNAVALLMMHIDALKSVASNSNSNGMSYF